MRYLTLLSTLFIMSGSGLGQVPEFYKEVTSLTWIVKDLDSTLNGWRNLGFEEAGEFTGGAMTQASFEGQAVDFQGRIATGYLGDFQIVWIEPGSGDSAFSEFLKANGEGVFSLNYRIPDETHLRSEMNRLESKGVKALQTARIRVGSIDSAYTFLDTGEAGKVALGLHVDSGETGRPSSRAPLGMRASQYAFVVRDLDPVSAYWAQLGFPAMEVTHGKLTDLEYRGRPGQFDQFLGWQRHGTIVFEWIEPIQGPTVYQEHLDQHGEGFHHVAFNVDDMDEAIEFFKSRGIECSQSGGWGEKGKPGSGRFAYVDTSRFGGITVELLWNHRGE